MSRSYRYDPEEAEFQSRPSWERPDEDFALGEIWPDEEESAAPKRKPRKGKKKASFHPPMSEEWAMDVMAPYVAKELNGLAERNIIAPHEVEDYTQILNIHICRMLPLYDEEHVGENGKTANVERYLTVAVNSAVTDIVRLATSKKSCLPMVPMPELRDDEDHEGETKCSDNHWVSDGCRSIRDLWFRMDLAVLSEMLTPEERLATNLRIQGYTFPEVAEEVSRILGVEVDRFHIMNVTMERVKKAARKCGFIPLSETQEKKS